MAKRKYLSPTREAQALRRRAGQRPPREVTLVVCERESERMYLELARYRKQLTSTEVVLAENTVGSAPRSVVDCALRLYRLNEGYDHVFCVFDRDRHSTFESSRQRIVDLARKARNPIPIREAISAPCFEIWLLLHYQRRDAAFESCEEVVRVLSNERALRNYKKADSGQLQQLVALMDQAISNAQWLEKRAPENDFNPYTSFHHVILHFDEMRQATLRSE